MKLPYFKMHYTKVKKVFSLIFRNLYLQDCKRNGMIYEKNLRIISSVDFGSEPYLIKIGDNVTISVGVLFSTHDGGGHLYCEILKK